MPTDATLTPAIHGSASRAIALILSDRHLQYHAPGGAMMVLYLYHTYTYHSDSCKVTIISLHPR